MALIGAAATIVAALIAAVVAVNTGAVEVSLSDPQADIEELRSTATSLRGDNDRLTEQNVDLQDQLDERSESTTVSTSTTRTGATTATTSAPPVRNSTVKRETAGAPLTFTWRYSADLDSDAVDWDVLQGSPGGWDLYVNDSGYLQTHEVVIFDHVPTEAECESATVRQPNLQSEQSNVGTMMCVRTSEDRFAFVRIAAVDEEARTASLDVVVWE